MKYTIKDIKKVIDHMENKVHAVEVDISFDDMNRLIVKANDVSANQVAVTIYAAEATKMPDVTETRRL